MKSVVAYIDGACKGNPGPGGWGVRIEFPGGVDEFFGGEKLTTNNKMELTAALKAIERCILYERFVIITDSRYLYDGVTSWVKTWEKRQWQNRAGELIKNKEMWQRLYKLNAGCNITWKWVKSHSDCEGNNRADILANRGVETVSTTFEIVKGSVIMKGHKGDILSVALPVEENK